MSTKVHTDERPEKPNGSAFQQQKLAHFYAQNNPPSSIICLFIVACAFIPIGAAIIVASDAIYEKDVRYDNIRSYTYNSCNEGAISYTTSDGIPVSMGCVSRTTFTIDEKISGPVYLYYRLTNFYQNYRPYAKSLSEDQVQGGDTRDSDWLGDCDPFRYPLGDTGNAADVATTVEVNSTSSGNLKYTYAQMTYSPCGAIAWSKFNDSISIYKVTNASLVGNVAFTANLTAAYPNDVTPICDGGNFDVSGTYTGPYASANRCQKKSIAFASDIDTRFKTIFTATDIWSGFGYTDNATTNVSDSFLRNGWYAREIGHKLPITTDEDFIVWSRIAGLSDFRKLYRRFDGDLEPGTYALEVIENFDSVSYDGEKHIIIATVGWVGGRNYVLGGLFVGFGGTAMILAIAFLIIYVTNKQEDEQRMASPASGTQS